MAKRIHTEKTVLNAEEYEKFHSDFLRSGEKTESEFLRKVIMEYKPERKKEGFIRKLFGRI